MQLDPEEQALITKTLGVVRELNTCLETLRKVGFACNIHEEPFHVIGIGSRWLLDIKAIIKKEHYDGARSSS